jgi:signal transduction histidine kinase
MPKPPDALSAPPLAPQVRRQRPFERVSLARQFLLASAVVLMLGVAATGSWVANRIEASVVNRTARMAAVYFESIVAGHLDELLTQGALSAHSRRMLDEIFVDGPLAQKVVRFKLWTPDGRIHYSSDHSQEQHVYPLHDHHAYALAGQMHAAISDLDGPDNESERARWSRLIEIYVPLRLRGAPEVRAVAEFYHSMDNIESDIRQAQGQSWVAITLGALLLYSGLYALVHRASRTISGQQSDLKAQLARLHGLLDDNRSMNQRLQQAGAQTASMSELLLRRIAADLHDGPAQDLAFALLTLDDAPATPEGAQRLRYTMQRAMHAIRGIAGGLIVPGMAQMSLAEVVRRAVDDATAKSGVAFVVDVPDTACDAPEAVKITAYRVVQEALSNNLRHAARHPCLVRAVVQDGALLLDISDNGPGFDASAPPEAGHLGLAFLRERVLLLGGRIDITAAPGAGAHLLAQLPLRDPEAPRG